MYDHVANVEACWTEVLRYRANKPYDEEMKAVRSGASWFKVNGRVCGVEHASDSEERHVEVGAAFWPIFLANELGRPRYPNVRR